MSDSLMCLATGCPLRGTLADHAGGRFFCVYHYDREPERWPGITQTLHGYSHVLAAIKEVSAVPFCDWKTKGLYKQMQERFAQEPDFMPTAAEIEHPKWYTTRLHQWLMYLTGSSSMKPAPREPLQTKAKAGNVAAHVSSTVDYRRAA